MNEPLPQSDHDLLIRLDEKVTLLVADMKEVKDNTNQKIAVLENSKLDRGDYQKEVSEIRKNIEGLDARMTPLQRFVWATAGAGLSINIALAIYSAFFKR